MTAPTGRYAPSPTGTLHLGNLRTAIAAYCWTRSRGGRFLLRIEDLDQPRVRPGCEEQQLADLEKLGIEWDEVPLRQSERMEAYRQAHQQLQESGHLFPCFCSRRDIQQAASAPHHEGEPAYPGTCRNLPPDESARRIANGVRHSWRLKVRGAAIRWQDEFKGDVEIDLGRTGGDFVVFRGDGQFAYQLACAIDDAASGVTEVLRGDDLLDSLARQAWLLQRRGNTPPAYAHIPLMHSIEKRRLSKREGDEDIRALGACPAQVRSYLAWTLGQAAFGEMVTMEELFRRFRLEAIPREPAVYRAEDLAAFR